MTANINNIDYAQVHQYEIKTKHDVMAHIAAFGDVAPSAKGIIHLGATSSFVQDNSELINMRDGNLLLIEKLKTLLFYMDQNIITYANLPTLGYTHFQAAQLTTVGKRISL